MFWSETVRARSKFCACEGGWMYFRIVHASPQANKLLELYMTPEDGNRNLVLQMRSGEPIPPVLHFPFNFTPWEHVRLELYGGDIVLVGEAQNGTVRYKATNHFPANCPFGDEDDWKWNHPMKIQMEKLGGDNINTKRS